MSAPVDYGEMGRIVESTLKALDLARGGSTGDTAEGEALAGRGEAAEGLISVRALAGGRLADLELDPRVMRMDSATLAEAIVTAANAALTDLANQLRAGAAGPDLNALADQLKEIQEQSTRQMGTFLQALVDAQERIANAGRQR